MIKELYNKGHSLRNIAKMLNVDRRPVRRHLQQGAYPNFTRTVNKPKVLDPYKNYICNFIRKSNQRIPYSAILEF